MIPEDEDDYSRLEDDNGSLSREVFDDRVRWTFIPRADRLAPNLMPPKNATLCEYMASTRQLCIYPIVPYADNDKYTEPKYAQIRRIRVDLFELDPEMYDIADIRELMDQLPGSFVKRWQFGLGLKRQYQPIISTVEDLAVCSELHISTEVEIAELTETSFRLPFSQFERLCAEIRRIDNRATATAMRFKRTYIHNNIADTFGSPARTFSRGRHPVTKLLSDEISDTPTLTKVEQAALVSATMSQARQIARDNPASLAALRLDVDLANLDELIDNFRKALTANHAEGYWQRFFQENPFALHLVFGYPLIQVQGQASVGGTTFSGRDGRFVDFLAKNATTGNIAIFEIKKPSSPLINNSQYRNSIHTPAADLTGAVGQVLDQKVELTKTLSALKEKSHIYDIHAYAIRCCVVIGRTPEDDDRKKALEAYRGNSSMVDVITYDELLVKLEQLRNLLGESTKS
ncbi:MAG: Shedu immune nuclease family protein [Pseudonocardiaceae bacterium]